MRGKDQSRARFRRVKELRRTLVSAGALLAGQDELDPAIHAAASGDTLERAAFGVKDHGLAGRVELELDPLGVGPRGRNVEGDAEPMAAGRVGELHIRGERVGQTSASLGPRGPETEAFGGRLEGLADRILERHLIEREYRSGSVFPASERARDKSHLFTAGAAPVLELNVLLVVDAVLEEDVADVGVVAAFEVVESTCCGVWHSRR